MHLSRGGPRIRKKTGGGVAGLPPLPGRNHTPPDIPKLNFTKLLDGIPGIFCKAAEEMRGGSKPTSPHAGGGVPSRPEENGRGVPGQPPHRIAGPVLVFASLQASFSGEFLTERENSGLVHTSGR